VRFFSVTIPLGTRAIGSSTGKTLSSGRLMENFNAEAAKIVRKCPVASRLIRTSAGMVTTVARGYSRPQERKDSIAAAPNAVSGGGSAHGSFSNSVSTILRRRTHGLWAPATATIGSSKRSSKLSRSSGAEFPCDQEIDITLDQCTVQRLYIRYYEMKHYTRIAARDLVDDGRSEARS
jgi:hypothetical protein